MLRFQAPRWRFTLIPITLPSLLQLLVRLWDEAYPRCAWADATATTEIPPDALAAPTRDAVRAAMVGGGVATLSLSTLCTALTDPKLTARMGQRLQASIVRRGLH